VGPEPPGIALPEPGGPGPGVSRPAAPARCLPLPAGPARGASAVTAIIVARNEETRIEGCLRSLIWADRILVIDNESSDRTAQIARRYTEWVIARAVRPGIEPNHDNLNYGFALIPEGWILHLDADERASAGLAREIREGIGGTTGHAAFSVPFRIAILGRWIRHGYWGMRSRQIRLFRAGRVRYPARAVHENPEVDGTIGRLESVVYHLPYPTIAEFVAKTNRWTSLDAERILSGDSPGVSGFGSKATHPSGLRLLWSAVRLFLWSFFRLGGWREGRIGIATSTMLGVYGFLEVLKVWERADGLSGDIELPEDDHV